MQENTPEQVREDQIRHARTTLGVKDGYERRGNTEIRHGHRDANKSSSRPFKKHVPKGHDAILAKLQESREVVTIYPMNDTESMLGRIVGRDKFTITVKPVVMRDGVYRDLDRAPITFYKHGIESFQPYGEFVPQPGEGVE